MVTECDGSDRSITIAFPSAGIEVAPFESDIRLDRRKYAYGEFTLTREAGELIANNVPDYSKAHIRISDRRAHRMVYFSDGLTFERDLNDNNIAELELSDASKILSNGTITANFERITLGGAVDYIMDQYGDPDNVINSYKFVGDIDKGERRVAAGARFALQGDTVKRAGGINTLDARASELLVSAQEKVDGLLGTDMIEDIHDGFDWEKTTPLQALSEVLQEFELDWWVTKYGVLEIGLDGSRGKVLSSTGSGDNIVIQHYGITSSPDRVRGVHLEGSYRTLNAPREIDDIGGPTFSRLVGIAEAVNTGSSGTVVAGEVQKGFSSLEELENIAERQLYRETINQTSGSIGINGLASTDKDTIAVLDVGDIILLDESLNTKCNSELITGLYLIFGVQHKRNPREGWTINVELTRIPDFNEVKTRSVWYDPEKDKEYDSLEEYRRDYDPGFNFVPTFDVPTEEILDS